jgi:hypothetical protein
MSRTDCVMSRHTCDCVPISACLLCPLRQVLLCWDSAGMGQTTEYRWSGKAHREKRKRPLMLLGCKRLIAACTCVCGLCWCMHVWCESLSG